MTSQEIKENEDTQKFRYFGIVKSGPYSGQKLEVVNYTPAHLELFLSTNGKRITSHTIRKRLDDGNYIVDELKRPVFELSLILPMHVFYLDLLLQNDNYAQVNKILPNNNILVTEKDSKTNKYSQHEISMNDIKQIQPGFKFGETDIKIKPQEDILISESVEDDTQSMYDDDDDSDSKEIDYATSPVDEDEERPQKASFKDTQRTGMEERKLTEQEKNIKTNIQNILRYLKMHDDSIDLYNTINIITSVIKTIKSQLKNINYSSDLTVTSNIKFIIVCVVIYDLIKVGFNNNLDEIISMLFPQYFSIKDIQADSMNDNIFLMQWNEYLSQERINESINKIKNYRSNEDDYPKIIKELLINADIVLQGLLGLHINIINRNLMNLQDLIPVGINPMTGRKIKEEDIEKSIEKTLKATHELKSKMVTVEDLINEKQLPETEVPIMWPQVYLPIIKKFKQTIQHKANTQTHLTNDYLYIRDNLVRAPFAIRDDIMKESVRKAFEGMYKTLLSHIIQQNIKLEKGKKRVREEQEQVKRYRTKLLESKPKEEEEEQQPQQTKNTASYIKEQKLRETKKSIAKATRAATRNAYMRRKLNQSQENKNDETKQNVNEPWWSQMDTSN
jgi:hypothetical protein